MTWSPGYLLTQLVCTLCSCLCSVLNAPLAHYDGLLLNLSNLITWLIRRKPVHKRQLWLQYHLVPQCLVLHLSQGSAACQELFFKRCITFCCIFCHAPELHKSAFENSTSAYDKDLQSGAAHARATSPCGTRERLGRDLICALGGGGGASGLRARPPWGR